MDDFIRMLIEQAPTFLGLIGVAVVLYNQNKTQQAQNDMLLAKVLELAHELKDCIQATSQQKEID